MLEARGRARVYVVAGLPEIVVVAARVVATAARVVVIAIGLIGVRGLPPPVVGAHLHFDGALHLQFAL